MKKVTVVEINCNFKQMVSGSITNPTKSDTVIANSSIPRRQCNASWLNCSGAILRRHALQTRYTLWRKDASFMKSFVWFGILVL